MLHRLSASGLSRARRCLYWARQDAVWPEQDASRHASFGTAVHEAIEQTIARCERVDPDMDSIDESDRDRALRAYDRWAEWWPSRAGEAHWQAEVPYAWNVRTGAARMLGGIEGRNYGPLNDYEVPGTADAVAELGDGTVAVIDWKTGRQPVESPTTNPQLAFLGGAAMAASGYDEAQVNIVKIDEDGVYEARPATLDAISATAIQSEVRAMIDAIPTSEPKSGPWCNYCPAKGACPATTASLVEVSSIVRRPALSLEIRDNDHAAGMLSAIDAVEDFVSELKKRLRAFADANGGILLQDGSTWSRTDVTTERPDLEAPGALAAIHELGASEAIESRTTWAAIKRVAGKEGEKAARERLRSLGAIKASTAPRYEAKAKKGRAA